MYNQVTLIKPINKKTYRLLKPPNFVSIYSISMYVGTALRFIHLKTIVGLNGCFISGTSLYIAIYKN